MTYFSTKTYFNNFNNFNDEWNFRKPFFKEWLSTLKVGDTMEVIRPNHTRRNGSSPFFNQGVCEIVEIKEDEVVFLKNSKKLHYDMSDFTISTNSFFYNKAKEFFTNN